MRMNNIYMRVVSLLLVFLLIAPLEAFSQTSGGAVPSKKFMQEELDQLLAPIALYPDSLLSQILMAATYPLEVVQADRWVKQNKNLTGDALTAALEKQDWDPSVKSLVNFPQVLQMMSEKLDWTQKLGDAFLAQEKDVMDTVQKLRAKAQAEGNLKMTNEQKIIVEKETIIIEPANPQVIYVPTYNPAVVYGPWWWPYYPPYYWYPPGYVAGAAIFSFGVGFAIGAAWGYAWGGFNWYSGHIDININKNININQNINRDKYRQQLQAKGQLDKTGKGVWQHDTSHRKGVAYKDSGTAQRFGQSPSRSVESRREARGYTERSSLDRQPRESQQRGFEKGKADKGAPSKLDSSKVDRGKPERGVSRDSAFSGISDGKHERVSSDRGQRSRGFEGGAFGGGGMRGGGRR